MKRFFSLFLIVALIAIAMILVACDEVEVQPIVSEQHHEHDLKSKVIKPTCVSGGYTEHTCTECSYHFRDTFVDSDDKAHSFSSWTVTVTPTCAIEKEEERTCQLCGLREVRVGKVAKHNYNVLVDELANTCTEDGYKTHKCEWCEETKTTVVAASHTFGGWQVEIPNIDDYGKCVAGLEYRECSECHFIEKQEIAPHSIEVLDTVQPTCAEKGYTVYGCKHCDFVYFGNYKNATGKHSFGDWVDYDDYIGYEAHYCTTCGHPEYRPKEDQ